MFVRWESLWAPSQLHGLLLPPLLKQPKRFEQGHFPCCFKEPSCKTWTPLHYTILYLKLPSVLTCCLRSFVLFCFIPVMRNSWKLGINACLLWHFFNAWHSVWAGGKGLIHAQWILTAVWEGWPVQGRERQLSLCCWHVIAKCQVTLKFISTEKRPPSVFPLFEGPVLPME